VKAALALAVLLLAAAVPVPVRAADAAAPPLAVLVFHPDDGVDPLGFSVAGSDPFSARYGPLVADKGRFDFPFFVADGVVPIESIPDTARPYVSAREAYGAAVDERSGLEPAAALRLGSTATDSAVLVQVAVTPRTDLSHEDLHLRLALVEDHVRYQPPPGLTNGVTDHRFTVRAYADLGVLALGAPANASHSFPLEATWARDRLSVAAWLQQDAPSPRFDAREVVQATQAPVGASVTQVGKGVLVEMLSATWCDPCLYGDKAVEDLAVQAGVAQPSSAAAASRYLHPVAADSLPAVAALVAGVAVVALAWRRP
jgi:thiol-disulfide isomerase/thioredoxin